MYMYIDALFHAVRRSVFESSPVQAVPVVSIIGDGTSTSTSSLPSLPPSVAGVGVTAVSIVNNILDNTDDLSISYPYISSKGIGAKQEQGITTNNSNNSNRRMVDTTISTAIIDDSVITIDSNTARSNSSTYSTPVKPAAIPVGGIGSDKKQTKINNDITCLKTQNHICIKYHTW